MSVEDRKYIGGWRWRLQLKLERRFLPDWKQMLNETYVVGRDLPDVPECYGYNAKSPAAMVLHPSEVCAQCDGSHEHEWRYALCLINEAFAYRCLVCGARKCDNLGCQSRRHHQDAHIMWSGAVKAVGS